MYAPSLIFKDRATEDCFRHAVDSDHEIGGWLLLSWDRRSIFDMKKFRRFSGTSYIYIVDSWLLVPNVASEPEWQYQMPNHSAFQASVELTAKSQNKVCIHFHSHPTGSNEPSNRDVSFTLEHCQIMRNCGESAIVSVKPLRLNAYYG